MRHPERTRLRVAVLIPALNEEAALPDVLRRLTTESAGGASSIERVVVVDNGSTDDTAAVAGREGAEVVSEPRKGYGAACLAGIRHLERAGAPDVLVFMDGDGSDDPAAIDRLLEPMKEGRAAFVIGVRGANAGGTHAVPLHARLGNAIVRGGARLLHGLSFRDLGPFRAIRFDTLRRLEMDDRNWGWTLQMQLRAHHLGVPTVEVSVPHHPRAAGRSKVSGSVWGSIRAGGKMLATLVTERLRGPLSGSRGTRGRDGATGGAPPQVGGGQPRGV